jgi:hypothetical protein
MGGYLRPSIREATTFLKIMIMPLIATIFEKFTFAI